MKPTNLSQSQTRLGRCSFSPENHESLGTSSKSFDTAVNAADFVLASWMERRRNFTVLATFLEENPDKDPRHFPPHRPIYMPTKQQEGWTILARRIGPETASGSAPP